MLFVAIFLTLPLTEMYATVGSAIVCDCLRLYGNNSLCDRLRSSAIIAQVVEHRTGNANVISSNPVEA